MSIVVILGLKEKSNIVPEIELFLKLTRVSSVRFERAKGSSIWHDRPMPSRVIDTTRLLMQRIPCHEDRLKTHCRPYQDELRRVELRVRRKAIRAEFSDWKKLARSQFRRVGRRRRRRRWKTMRGFMEVKIDGKGMGGEG